MPNPGGFLKTGRQGAPRRPIDERVQDYRHVYLPLRPADASAQASRCMDCGVPFCATGCPLGNHIPDWNDLVHGDRWRLAIDRLHRTNNFPEFTGLLCPAPCEAACVLAVNDSSVTIREIELSIVDRAWNEGWILPVPPHHRTGKRVAVVGSGPTGLAAAQQLNRAGHHVTVFERDDRPGGLLRYGIPDFKLEKWVLDRRLEQLATEGVQFETGAHVGISPTADDLLCEYDAVLLAVGALAGRDVPVPGRELPGVHFAMEYLTQQNRRVAGLPMEGQQITARGKRVVILGGGDTSADCLGNAHREGAASVQVLTHGPQPPGVRDPLTWPDWPFVLRTYPAHEEGGERRWSVTVTAFSGSDAGVEQVHLAEVERLPDGTRRLLDHRWTVEADLVLLAVGFTGPVRDALLQDLDVPFAPNGAIATDDFRALPGVYAAGDARLGASLIVDAIAEGRKAAAAIDRALAAGLTLRRSVA